MFNSTVVVGRLVRDPECKVVSTGTKISEFTIVLDERKKVGGEWVDSPIFLDIVAFGKTAEIIGDYANKGSLIVVSGKLSQDKWERDGVKHTKIKVVADTVKLLDKKGNVSPPTDSNVAPSSVVTTEEEIPF